jgi:hypothetical protein
VCGIGREGTRTKDFTQFKGYKESQFLGRGTLDAGLEKFRWSNWMFG